MRRILLPVIFFTIILSFNATAQSWKSGYYYDTTFTKVSGLIKSKQTYILFKNNKDARKIKVVAKDMNSYVAGADSFVVSRMPEMDKIPIVKVLIDNPVKLYTATQSAKFNWGGALAGAVISVGGGWGVNLGNNVSLNLSMMPSFVGGGQSIYYLYGYGPDDLQPLTDKNFVKIMSGIMSDNPGIVQKIKDRTANINNLEEWVDFYHKERATQPVAN